MIKKLAMAFGVVFLLVGILGFVPAFLTDSDGHKLLLGIFAVDTIHNVIHLASGLAALAASSSSKFARLYFQIFGAVYGLVTVVGFIQGDTVLGLIHVNMQDNVLHLIISAAALWVGFGLKEPMGSPDKM